MRKPRYICNGRNFESYDEAVKHAESLGLRIVNSCTIQKGIFLFTLAK